MSTTKSKKITALSNTWLVSIPTVNAVAVLDLEQRTCVWALAGLWVFQHQPSMLDDGRLLVFDNMGADGTSRVLELDPSSQQVAWQYRGDEDAPLSSDEESESPESLSSSEDIEVAQTAELLPTPNERPAVAPPTPPRKLWYKLNEDGLTILDRSIGARVKMLDGNEFGYIVDYRGSDGTYRIVFDDIKDAEDAYYWYERGVDFEVV